MIDATPPIPNDEGFDRVLRLVEAAEDAAFEADLIQFHVEAHPYQTHEFEVRPPAFPRVLADKETSSISRGERLLRASKTMVRTYLHGKRNSI
jgi:hypothetical protein